MDPRLHERLNGARSLYRSGRFPEAETAFRSALEIDPRNAVALEGLGTIALWANHPADAELNLLAAARAVSAGQRLWPFAIGIDALLALAYYRMDDFPQAARQFAKAAGPVPFGPFGDLRALSRQLGPFCSRIPYLLEGPAETRVEFVRTDPLPVVEVTVNGSRPLLFFIDTGAAEIILDPSLAAEVGAELSGTMTGESAGPNGRIGLGRVDSVRLGEMTVRNVPIHTVDTRPFASAFGGMEVEGVIGTRLLMHFLATLDYPGAALILRRAPSPDQPAGVTGTAAPGKAIPFWLIQTHYIVAWGKVNGRGPVLFFVDTGLAGRGFTAPESVLREAGIRVDWSKAVKGVGGFGSTKEADFTAEELMLGLPPDEIVERDVPGAALDKPPGILGDRLGFRIDGLISHGFFRRYALTLDFQAMRLFLEKG